MDAVATIHRSGEHLLLLINDLLDISRIEAQKLELHPTPFPLPLFVKNLIETARIRVGQKELRVVAECAPDLPATVLADERRLPTANCQLLTTNLSLEVSDTGAGIPPEHLPHIFGAFYQGDHYAAQEGSGLGLTISQQLVRLMGSELYVRSTTGQGSIFWFDLALPVVAPGASEKTIPARPLLGYAGERRKILLVDDNAENRGFLRDLLLPLGFELQEAANGRDVLTIAQNWQPHLILMDLLMSPMDGFETTRRIRAEEQNTGNLKSQISNLKSQIPIIAISASIAESVRQESLVAGGDDFLAKPVRIADLLECLRRHLGLEWIYADAAKPELSVPKSMPLVVPPADFVQQLLDLAQGGYVNDLEDRLAELAHDDVGYRPFVDHMNNLARNLHLQQLIEELSTYKNEI